MDASGQQISANDCAGNPDSLNDNAQIRCDYARRLYEAHPESGGLEYWLRFSVDGLRESYSIHKERQSAGLAKLGDNLAIVPLDFQPVSGLNARPASYQQQSVEALRRLEQQLDRPATFVELLAIILRGELADILNSSSLPKSECGLETAEFQRLTENAAQRFFHGSCRRDGRFGDSIPPGMSGITGECGAGRLIGTTMSNVESFYDSLEPIAGYERWINRARRLFANSTQPTGYACTGDYGSTYNEPWIWGNFTGAPTIGINSVMDFVEHDPGGSRGFTHFAIQYSPACTTHVRCSHSSDYGVTNQRNRLVPNPKSLVGSGC